MIHVDQTYKQPEPINSEFIFYQCQNAFKSPYYFSVSPPMIIMSIEYFHSRSYKEENYIYQYFSEITICSIYLYQRNLTATTINQNKIAIIKSDSIIIIMINYTKALFLFALGIRDSISLKWLNKLVLRTHPTTKKIHPQSYTIINTLKQTFVQVVIFLIGIPAIFRYVFNQEAFASILGTFFLLLTYGYLFFYNNEIMTCTRELLLWSFNAHKTESFPEADIKQKSELFYTLSNTVKSFVFLLLYYLPIFIACLIMMSIFPLLGSIMLLISQSFFNSAFYFLKKWPYDQYNVAFLERNLPYMLGYGFMVSFVTNIMLSGDIARGLYLLISQWMIINVVLYSPPEVNTEEDIETLRGVLVGSKERSSLKNDYNQHRMRIRNDKKYRELLIENITIIRPALKITEILNSLLANKMGQNL